MPLRLGAIRLDSFVVFKERRKILVPYAVRLCGAKAQSRHRSLSEAVECMRRGILASWHNGLLASRIIFTDRKCLSLNTLNYISIAFWYMTDHLRADMKKSTPKDVFVDQHIYESLSIFQYIGLQHTGSYVKRCSFRQGTSERTRFLNNALRIFSVELFPSLFATYANLVTRCSFLTAFVACEGTARRVLLALIFSDC